MVKQRHVQENWSKIKDALRQRWGNLRDAELEESQGNLSAIRTLIMQNDGIDSKTASAEMMRILKEFGPEDTLFHPAHEEFYESHPTAPRSLETSAYQDEVQDIKTRSPERTAYEQAVEKAKDEQVGDASPFQG